MESEDEEVASAEVSNAARAVASATEDEDAEVVGEGCEEGDVPAAGAGEAVVDGLVRPGAGVDGVEVVAVLLYGRLGLVEIDGLDAAARDDEEVGAGEEHGRVASARRKLGSIERDARPRSVVGARFDVDADVEGVD